MSANPKNVRNFWIEAEIDGRTSKFASGPKGKDGGFYLNIFIRKHGEVHHALNIIGYQYTGENIDGLCLSVKNLDTGQAQDIITER